MSNEESKSDLVKEAREHVANGIPVCGVCARLLSSLCDEVEELKRDKTFLGERLEAQAETLSRVVAERNQLREVRDAQAESITHLQSQQRVMKEAIEAAIPWIEAEIDSLQCSTHDQPTHCADCALRYRASALVKQLRSAITPKGSEK